jgi:hypothetical protein
MRSVADDVFEMSDASMSIRLRFELGPDGSAQSMNHNLDSLPTPLRLVGPLPQGWEGCVQHEGR